MNKFGSSLNRVVLWHGYLKVRGDIDATLMCCVRSSLENKDKVIVVISFGFYYMSIETTRKKSMIWSSLSGHGCSQHLPIQGGDRLNKSCITFFLEGPIGRMYRVERIGLDLWINGRTDY